MSQPSTRPSNNIWAPDGKSRNGILHTEFAAVKTYEAIAAIWWQNLQGNWISIMEAPKGVARENLRGGAESPEFEK